MIIECLGEIKWDDPVVFGPLSAAVVGGLCLIVNTLIKNNKPASAPVELVLPEKDVGPALSEAVDPLRREVSSGFKALGEKLAAQLAPKQQVPDSGEPLKIKAVEFYNAGRDAYEKGEIGQALGHFLDARQLDPDYVNAPNAIGVVLNDKGEVDAAIEHYSAALRIDPNYAKAHNNLGAALKDKGDLDAAIKHLSAALRIDPDYEEAHNNLGNALRAKDELDAAIEHYQTAIQINSKSAMYHDNLGTALAQKKDAAEAVAALAKAIELDQRYRDWAKTDKNYDPIRDDPAFRKLVYGE